MRADVYGQSEGFDRRVLLIYDGAHWRQGRAPHARTRTRGPAASSGAAGLLFHHTPHHPILLAGLHYDALAVAASQGAPEAADALALPSRGPACEAAMAAAAALVARAHAGRQFTDTANFTLRCNVCRQGLKGEREAVAHAQATGHADFSEYA